MPQFWFLDLCDIDFIPHVDIFDLHGFVCKEVTVLLKDGQLTLCAVGLSSNDFQCWLVAC